LKSKIFVALLATSEIAHAQMPQNVPQVHVRGEGAGARLRRGAEAVSVVDTERDRQKSEDLGQVMEKAPGIRVRRAGGLGAAARLSLNGFEGEQVRIFVNGLPLAYAGFGFNAANVPVDFVDRVEVYRGVVPVRFGGDALGGAINLVTEPEKLRGKASLSYQIGSFATYRTTAAGQYYDARSGFFARTNAFLDHAKNNYPIDVRIPDARGRLSDARVVRFHDGYAARGVALEGGVANRPWAKRLSLRIYENGSEKELQHNLVMSVPYGEARTSESGRGVMARYRSPVFGPKDALTAGVTVGFARRRTDFVDRSDWVYDWFGHRIRSRPTAGEISGEPLDQSIWQNDVYLRADLSAHVAAPLVLRATVAPTRVWRTGESRVLVNPTGRDPLSAGRDLFTWVNGVEAELFLFGGRLRNVVFGKQYWMDGSSEEVLPGFQFRTLGHQSHSLGWGDALRFRITDALDAKASYEYATRLPSPDEIFGNGVLITPNLNIVPEVSDNANLGLTLDSGKGTFGAVRSEVNGFWRAADQLIALLSNDRFFGYQNVLSARSMGLESSLGYATPGDYFALEGNLTVQDLRNRSLDGPFRDFEGDRIPNLPWLFGGASARVALPAVLVEKDELSFEWTARYVHEFYRSWESQGAKDTKPLIPSQLLHTAALGYLFRGPSTVSATIEVQNLTDERAYDYFGVQRPGRAFFFKGIVSQDFSP